MNLEPDDILCLYTDRLPEARNAAGDLLDIPRFTALIAETRQYKSLNTIADHVIHHVQENTATQKDDWTLLLVKLRATLAAAS